MTWKPVTSDSPWEKKGAFSRALYDDDWVFVSGTTGFDYSAMTISEDFSDQVRQTLKNIDAALKKAGSHLGEIVSQVVYVTDRKNVSLLSPVLKEMLPQRPTATCVIVQLVDERMKVEISVVARRHATIEATVPAG